MIADGVIEMAKVRDYQRVLQEVGPSLHENGVVKYTYIKIGGE